MTPKQFCKRFEITEDQFYGKEPIEGNLSLHNNSLTSLPEGFNPTVGGNLYLDNNSLTSLPEGFNPTVGGSLLLDNNSLTSLPEGFNPTVGGSLYLDNNSLTSLPEGFNPTVGGDLYLSNNSLTSLPEGFNPTVGGGLYLDNNSLTSLPDGFNPTVGGSLWLQNNSSKLSAKINRLPDDFVFSWQNGKYIRVDGILTEVISKRGGVYKVKVVGKKEISYLITDGEKWAHGNTLQEAKSDLMFKVGNRSKGDYKGLKVTDKLSLEDGVVAYRVITGACMFGVKQFLSTIKPKKQYTVSEIIDLTKSQYGGQTFAKFFNS
jgi:hypothetical protein